MLTAFAGSWRAFAGFRALLGAGEAGNFPSGAKAACQWFRPGERTVATGIFNMGAGLGQAIATPFVVYLILQYSWQAAFVATGAIGILWLAVWLLVYRAPEAHPWLSPGELAHIRAGQQELGRDEGAPGGVWRVVLAQRNFWAIAIARFLAEPAWSFFTYWIPLYLATERHMRLKDIGSFAWLPFVAGDVGCLFGGFLSPVFIRRGLDVITARKLAASTCALLMVFAISIGSAPSSGWAIALFCVGAFAHQALSSTLLTLPADLFPSQTVATANGLSGMAGYMGALLFTKVVGIVVMKVGYAPLFVAISFFDLIGAAFLWGLLRQPEASARPKRM
jgi:ACS family hexuronate transporter-like MFS transporter